MMKLLDDRIGYLDGIRGVAICLVFAVHWNGGRHLGSGGYIGVDVFFVLSGYVITISMLRRPCSYWSFMRRRCWRLIPALLVMIVVVSVIRLVFLGLPASAVARDGMVAVLQLASPAQAASVCDLGALSIAWSLAVEWYFHMLWPFAIARLRFWAPRRSAVVVLILAIGLWLASLPMNASWFYFGPVAHCGSLLLGASAAFASLDGVVLSARWVGLFAVPVALWGVFGESELTGSYKMVLPLVSIFTAWVILCRGGGCTRWLELSWLRGLGRMSYSVYLWHAVPPGLLVTLTSGAMRPILGVFSIVAVALVTRASYLWLEQLPQGNSRGRAGRAIAASGAVS